MKDFFELRESKTVNLQEASTKVKTTMPDKVASSATRFGLKSKSQGGHVSISGPKGKLNDFLRAIIGRSSYGNASELSENALEENKIFFVKVGDGRDSMTVKTKAANSREALKKMRAQHPKDKVSLDSNQKQGQPAGALESVEEAYRKPTQAEIDADRRKDGKGKDTSSRYKNIKKKMYGNAMGGLKSESTSNFRQSIDRIQAKKTRDSLTPSEKDKLAKLHALMKKQRKTGNYKMESAELEEQKYAVKYTHPTDKKSGKTTGPLSKAAAEKKATMGNKVDKVGGKYTVIRHVGESVQEVTEVKLSDREIHNKIANRNLLVKAIKTAEKMGGNMTGAVREIEKMKKGLSKHKAVQAALRQANESVRSADKKPQNFRDPETGKMKVRMVPVDRDIASRKTNESVEEEVESITENYRTLATHGMGAETKNSINVGRDVDYYEPKNGDKRQGRITKVTRSGYVVKDEKDGKSHAFAFHDRAKAKEIMAKNK